MSFSKTSTEFYSQLADNYDDMTRFRQRVNQERMVLSALQKKYKFKSALDAACGTGLHAILLHKSGVRTIGVDNSQQMLDKAAENAERLGTQLTWIHSDLHNLTRTIDQTFDVILCLGNSIPHITEEKVLLEIFGGWYQLLNPNGYLILQILNYNKILREKARIISITRQPQREFIRFYDFLDQKVQFNVLVINWAKHAPLHSLHSTILYPYKKKKLESFLHLTNYSNLKFYGDLKMANYSENQSTNLVIVAQKSIQE